MAQMQIFGNSGKTFQLRPNDSNSFNAVSQSIDAGYTLGKISVDSVASIQIDNINSNGNSASGAWIFNIYATVNGQQVPLGTFNTGRTGTGKHSFYGTATLSTAGRQLLANYKPSTLSVACTNGWYQFYSDTNFTMVLNISQGNQGSTLSIPSTVQAGQDITSTISSFKSTNRHTIQYSLAGQNSAEYSIAMGVTQHTFTVPLNWINELPNSTKGTASALLKTYEGTQLLSSNSYSFEVTVPSNIVPTSLSLSSSVINGYDGLYLKSVSQARITASASGAYSSTISGLTVTSDRGGYSSTSFPYTTGTIGIFGDIKFTLTARDSRGRTATTSITINVSDYSDPVISNQSAFRSNASGEEQSNGTNITVKCNYTITPLSGNTATANVSYKRQSDSSWSESEPISSGVAKTIGNDNINVQYGYNVRIQVQDKLKTTTLMLSVGSENVLYDIREDRAAFGGWTDGANRFKIPTAWTLYSGPINASGNINGYTINGDSTILSHGSEYPWFQFLTARNSKNENLVSMVTDAQFNAGNPQSPVTSVRCFSRNSNGTMTGFAEVYNFPYPNLNRTASQWFNILTTKNLVTIGEGGTGAGNATAARNNLKIYNGTTSAAIVGGSGTERTFTITFPTPFTSNPTVVASADDAGAGIPVVCSISSPSKTGFYAFVRNEFFTANLSIKIHWIAIGT